MAHKTQRTASTGTPERAPLWTNYRVRMLFITRLCASVPADPEIVKKWLEARQPRVKPAGAKSIEETAEEVIASLERGEGEADQDYSMLVFQRNNGALVQRYGTVRAHYKDCARVLSAQYVDRIQGERAFSTRVTNGVYLDPRSYWLPITREDGSPVTAADGAFDKAVHAYVPGKGQISALKRFEFIDPPSVIEFTLKVLGGDRTISESDLLTLFEYGGVHGYGGERGDGEGRYLFTLERGTVGTGNGTRNEKPVAA
jgi:hypothetical protein